MQRVITSTAKGEKLLISEDNECHDREAFKNARLNSATDEYVAETSCDDEARLEKLREQRQLNRFRYTKTVHKKREPVNHATFQGKDLDLSLINHGQNLLNYS